ncbi:MAG: magnesium transporter [Microbacteriaceae bacterium]|jgi:magnesium transporter|nr:magnesium transporter [Microbacteriaceae bacterium]HPZ34868.1 magnesium transporter [Microbacteriaceae bacterium]HQC92308.1 magnesium transporter [Microbacteriaceae bacterium]
MDDDEFDVFVAEVEPALKARDLPTLGRLLGAHEPEETVRLLEREDAADRAVLYRLLSRDRALAVFEMLDPAMRSELFTGLRDEDVARLFEELDPDDRAQLVDELPAGVAQKLMRGLSARERELTAPLLGYPRGSVGRRMSTEYVRLQPQLSVGAALRHVQRRGVEAETIYTLPVTDGERQLLGVIGLRDLVMHEPERLVGELMAEARQVRATEEAEQAARACVDANLLALPVVDGQDRLLGILTVDDAARILSDAEDEDAARAGASEPLRRPYLATPIFAIMRSRVVWLLVLAVSALLTVQVLEIFEDTLAAVVTLALFIPLLTGTAGNTGSQAATTVTRALALGDVRLRDAGVVAFREVRVGFMLGAFLGALGFILTTLVYSVDMGIVIGVTLLSICTMAATVGGLMPMLARAIRVDPAVFSTPFISTFCDATGLLIYFLIATSVLGL